MGLPTNEQTVATGADGLNDWQKVVQGPFNTGQRNADGTFKTIPGFVHTLSVSNDDTTKKTISFYDDATSTTNPIWTAVVPPGDTRTYTPDSNFFNALRVAGASWTGVIASASWA